MRRYLLIIQTFLTLLCATSVGFSQNKGISAVYVWDFSDRALQKTDLTANFTHDFEAALLQFGGGKFRVVERRQLDRLLGQGENEKKIANASELPPVAIEALKTQKADQVIFGEVYDDVSSGQVSITVTFEDFSGQKRLLKSILIARGTVNDAASRSSAMEKLVKDIVSKRVAVFKKESDAFLFEIERCTQSDKVVTVNFTVTNNQDDRNMRIDAMGGAQQSRLFDDSGNEVRADMVKVANKSSSASVELLMVSGLPIKCQMIFDGVSAKASSISRLEICYTDLEIHKDFCLVFRNIEFEK